MKSQDLEQLYDATSEDLLFALGLPGNAALSGTTRTMSSMQLSSWRMGEAGRPCYPVNAIWNSATSSRSLSPSSSKSKHSQPLPSPLSGPRRQAWRSV